MVRPRAKSSSILVSVVRSTAVRLEPTRRRPVWMSVTVAAVPSRSRTRGADAVRDRNLVVMAVVAGALANKRNARPTAEPAQHRTGVGRRGSQSYHDTGPAPVAAIARVVGRSSPTAPGTANTTADFAELVPPTSLRYTL